MVNELKERLIQKGDYLLKNEIERLEEAIDFGEKAHHGQKRATGEPYITHPIAVCEILLEYRADITSLISSLLHDVVEDTPISSAEIKEKFGEQVSSIVEGLTKVEKGQLDKEEYHAINTEKLLSASVKDIRVAVIKIADRLHNMRTLAVKKVEKKVPYANETLLFFSPLAERLGLYKIQEELEEIGFGYLNPSKFHRIEKLMNNYSNIFAHIFNRCLKEVKKEGGAVIIDLEWSKVPIYKASSLLQEDQDLMDLFCIKVITKSTIDCYTALGIIHRLYNPIEHQFIDHIAIEKSPFLRQLYTKVLIRNVKVNFTIQTECDKKMNDSGVFGLLKKDLSGQDLVTLGRMLLGDSICTVQTIAKTPIEFQDIISFDLLQREITACTPKMDVVLLPEGSTIIDFAFSLDPHLAKRMFSAKINGELKLIHTIIHDMDIVEIQTTNKETVHPHWLNFAQTSKAQKEISEWLNI
ncbi:HD domain-containing protein [Lederbergia sp. NSJ-179]|uniref:HD domain-containing protein n=1 Tax=Lederbergia sp. NSJ-179 TaxID=2931402 RepID=UPI001FD27C83|nr:HD domain-containing protein [Lederbergia sp. NSJ-179]MCJ7840835.1 HD domain-containing protein [Lederbergia sp. NSJ-179]